MTARIFLRYHRGSDILRNWLSRTFWTNNLPQMDQIPLQQVGQLKSLSGMLKMKFISPLMKVSPSLSFAWLVMFQQILKMIFLGKSTDALRLWTFPSLMKRQSLYTGTIWDGVIIFRPSMGSPLLGKLSLTRLRTLKIRTASRSLSIASMSLVTTRSIILWKSSTPSSE